MDFFEHQDRARRKTWLLIGYFVAAVVGVVLSVYLAAMGILALAAWQEGRQSQLALWQPGLFSAIVASTLAVILTGSLYKIVSIGGSGEHVALGLGGRQVNSNTRELSERILLNVVEEMAIASGTPVPPVYLMEEDGINAFAAGTTPQNAVIGVTRGAVQTLRRDELQGVIAHEFSHILNGDMRLNIRLMGWLHGILVIAMIGYMVLRIMSQTSRSASSSSRSDKKGGGGLALAILLMAVALIVIGYVGVFFAQLIKAAVSRQREFLADASAVQFTRNPAGLAGALLKIGGWKSQARIRVPQAEESSHMFFGSAVPFSLFATHPPLEERIRRLEPHFDGRFPTTTKTQHTLDEIIEPHALAQRHSNFSSAHAAAVAGAQRLGAEPSRLVQSVGQPRQEHLDQAHTLVDVLEAPLADDLRDPLGASAAIFALLLAPPESQARQQQLEVLGDLADRRMLDQLRRVLPSIDRLAPEQRLPVACLALPALHQMSPRQVTAFQNRVQTLIRSDSEVSLFEFAVQRFIAKRLAARLPEKRSDAKLLSRSLRELQPAFTLVLSALANLSGSDNAEAAFAAGVKALQKSARTRWESLEVLPADECTVANLDRALDELAQGSPRSRQHMLAGFTATIAFDGHMSVREGELLRVIADALGCPVPPIL